MKFNRFLWDNYRQTNRGKSIIEEFSRLEDLSDGDLLSQVRRFNPGVFNMVNPESFLDILVFFLQEYGDIIDSPVDGLDDACRLYSSISDREIKDEIGRYVVKRGEYPVLLQGSIPLSYALSFAHPEYFFPNLYPFRFEAFVRLCGSYEDLDVPEIPKKSDYKGRYMYYMEMCRMFHDFRARYGLSPAELCAFLYDFAPRTIEEADGADHGALPEPSSIWCIGGSVPDPGGLWQCSEETRRGDILLYYQKSPVSAFTHILRADSDGLVDPFFHYYSRAYLRDSVSVPHIGLEEMKSDGRLAALPLVRKNLQGVNGWPLKNGDYLNILAILREKGFNTSSLPMLPVMEFRAGHRISLEKDVEEYLLNPWLRECGVSDGDYVRQMPLHMGRGVVKYPDYAVFADVSDGYETAAVIIEAKLEIKTNKEREEAFKQARSYALRLEADYTMLCDRNSIWIYKGADRVRYERYSWAELRTPEVFARMKRLFSGLKSRKRVQKT